MSNPLDYNEHAAVYSAALIFVFQVVIKFFPCMAVDFSNRNYHRVVIYCAGLCFCHKYQTALGISRQLGGCTHDALTQMLNATEWTASQLMMLCMNAAIRIASLSPQPCWLILDDVILPKKNTKKILAAHYDYDYLNDRKVPCVRIVVLCWTNGIIKIPVSFLLWHKENSIYLKESGIKYRSKNRLARILVYQAKKNHVPFDYLLFDTWYSGTADLTWYHNRGIRFVTSVKNNRGLCLPTVPLDMKPARARKNTQIWVETSPKKLADQYAHTRDYRFYQSIQCRVRRWDLLMKGFPAILSLVCIKNYVTEPAFKEFVKAVDKKQKDPNKYLLTNDPNLSITDIVKWYRRRWAIEVLFRDCKQKFGLNACQAERVIAHEHHIACVFFSYVLMEHMRPFAAPSEKEAKTLTIGQIIQWLRNQNMFIDKTDPYHLEMHFFQISRLSEKELILLLKSYENGLETQKIENNEP